MNNRVVVTGLGVCAPNGTGVSTFSDALSKGKSGITFHKQLEDLNFSCQIAGSPNIQSLDLNEYFTKVERKGLNANGLIYGVIAGVDAWTDAGLEAREEEPDWNSGIVFGTGVLGVDKFREAIYQVDRGEVRRLGSTAVAQTMASGISAFLGGKLGVGNQVTTNSSACSTGTEALIMGFDRIASGKATRILVGSCSDSGPYVWGGFDAMRILPRKFNMEPEKASQPMSATASGFVPGSGAGALVLESLNSAIARGAPIYCEVLGGFVNSGGQRQGGSMTAANKEGVQRCIQQAIAISGITSDVVDAVNGHLTATQGDPIEIENWAKALNRSSEDFPYVNSFKGHIGHCLAASGSIECVGTVLQFKKRRLFGTLNCKVIHPDILNWAHPSKILQQTIPFTPKVIAKASFGFGDVNACVIFKAYSA